MDENATTAGHRCGALLTLLALASALLLACATSSAPVASNARSTREEYLGMMIRLSELEIEPASLDEYVSVLREEAAASVRLEPGVLAIFPMQQSDNATQVRILEMYASKAAYEAHLRTPHFRHYKNGTLSMVRSLRLVDMTALDRGNMPTIFTKLSR